MTKTIALALFIEVTAYALGITFVPSRQYLLLLWIAVGVHLIIVVWLYRKSIVHFWRDRLHIGYSTIRKGEDQQKAEEAAKQNERREKTAAHIRALSRSSFLGKPVYDARTATVEADVKFPSSLRRRLMGCATWLVNRRLVPTSAYISLGTRLGYRYKAPPT